MNIKNLEFSKIIIIILLTALTIIFSIFVFNTMSLGKWAKYQNTCIEKESLKSTIPWAVRKCNGRSKVYQVK